MRAGRVLLVLALIGAGTLASVMMVARGVSSLRRSGFFTDTAPAQAARDARGCSRRAPDARTGDALSQEAQLPVPAARAGRAAPSPAIEQIARTQVALGEPSIVRVQLTPAPSLFEELVRTLYRHHEQRLAREEHADARQRGLSSTLNRAEMTNAQRTQNRSLFWLEMITAANTTSACKTLAAAVQARRVENRLHRRLMIVRQRLYRRRFPHALGPLIPSMRSLVSAAEVAQLLELPTARMKGVPVRRATLPRIPVPPEVGRGRRARAFLDTLADPSANGLASIQQTATPGKQSAGK